MPDTQGDDNAIGLVDDFASGLSCLHGGSVDYNDVSELWQV
jgi:hypothetical protein